MRARWFDRKVALAVLGLVGLGCSLGEVDVGGDATDGTTGSTTANTAGSGSLDDTSGGTDGDESSGPEADQCDVDCGEGGLCDLDEDGAPSCTCFDGYAAYGLRCLPCTPSGGEVELDIPRVEVSASFLLAGEPFPASFYEHAAILLRDPATGDEVELGDTADGGSGEVVAVIPGTYEVHYARRAGGHQVPANRGAKIDTVRIPAEQAVDLEVDVPVVELSGTFTINGAAPPTGQYENGTIVLRDPATGDEVELGDTRDGGYEARVVPGRYQVHYRRRLAEAQAPINGDARLGEVEITDDGAFDLDVDVPVTMLSGTITLDGAAPPDGSYENGRILLRDRVTGDRIVLGQTRDASFSAPVVAGDYDVYYQRLLGGLQVPVNTFARLRPATLSAGAESLDVDIATAIITGEITVEGSPPPAEPSDDGVLMLRDLESGDEAVLGNTAAGSYSSRVVLGEYDVYYRQETSSGGVPVNTNARLQSVVVRGGTTLDVDIPMVTVSATVTVGGELPPDSAYDDGLLYLRNAQTGDSVLLGNTRLGTLQRPVVPGTYDLHYVVEAAGPTMPVNARARLDTIEVGPGIQLDVDIPVVDFHGVITVAGEAPPVTFYDRAVLLLHDVGTRDVIYLGAIEQGELSQSLTAGTYVVTYRSIISNGLVPANEDAGVACIELMGP